MDVLNQLSTQLRDLFQSMTPGARITAGLLLAVVVVSLAILFQQNAAGPDEYLFSGRPLSTSEINRMVGAMSEAGLSGWEVEQNFIRVPRGQKDAYIAAIVSAGAQPHDFASFMNEALDKASPLESRQQWELRTKSARESQFSHLISLMPWVEQASVMFEIEERRGFGSKHKASASVFVVPRSGEGLDKRRMRNLQKFVAGTMTSLSPDDVHITSGGDESYASDEALFDDPYLQAVAEIQRSYRQQILQELSYIPGLRVAVTGDVDNLSEKRRVESTPSDGANVREVTEDETIVSSKSGGGGRPGVTANGANRPGLDESLASENQSRTERSTSSTEKAVGVSTIEEQYSGYKPKEMYASIAVPRDYVADVWKKRNPNAAEEELTATVVESLEGEIRIDIENFVQNILPRLTLGEDDYSQVKVVFYDPPARASVPKPSFAENAMTWASRYWSTLSMIGLAMFSLLMLRSVVRPGSVDAHPPVTAALQLELGDEEPTEQTDREEPARPKLKLRKGDSLKDDLSEMVREDPDGAAAILRSWISNAG